MFNLSPEIVTTLWLGYSRKNPNRGVEDILFWKALLEILDLPLYPKNFRRKNAFTPGILQICVTPPTLEIPKSKIKTHGNSALVFLGYPCNFHFFFDSPLEFPHVFSSRPSENPCPQPSLSCLDFPGIAHCWRSKWSQVSIFLSN